MPKKQEARNKEALVQEENEISSQVGDILDEILTTPGVVDKIEEDKSSTDKKVFRKFEEEESDDYRKIETKDEEQGEELSSEDENQEDPEEGEEVSTPDESEEPEDELMELSRKGLEKLVEKEKYELEVKPDMTDEDLRKSIRDIKSGIENDPELNLAAMRDWMNEQAEEALKQGQQVPAAVKPEETPKPPEVKPVVDASVTQITLSEEDYNSALQDKSSFNKVMNDVASVAQQQTVQKLIPAINQLVTQQISLNNTVNDFYADNPDLKPFKQMVSLVAQSIQSKNPDRGFVEILKETETVLRDKMKLKKDETKVVNNKNKVKANFAGSKNTNSRKGTHIKEPKLNSVEQEIWNLVNDPEVVR